MVYQFLRTFVDSSISRCPGWPGWAAPVAADLPNMHLAIITPSKATTTTGIPKAKGKAAALVYFLQVEVHPSPSFLLPSSHCSPGLRIPSPHSNLQRKQPSPLTLFPSSHCSPLLLVMASPQYSTIQLAEQPSPSFIFPSPHTVELVALLMYVTLQRVALASSLVVRSGTFPIKDSRAWRINFFTVTSLMFLDLLSNS